MFRSHLVHFCKAECEDMLTNPRRSALHLIFLVDRTYDDRCEIADEGQLGTILIAPLRSAAEECSEIIVGHNVTSQSNRKSERSKIKTLQHGVDSADMAQKISPTPALH